MSYLELSGVTKRFGDLVAVDDISFSVEEGEFVSLLGPSGCGKTTTLRMIAGLETPNGGTISIEESVVNAQPAHKRNIGMVFQHYALFPHKTVGENIGFPLKMRDVSNDVRRRKTQEALELVELPGIIDRAPSELSGGQQQRVALARALVFEPKLLLLDEPISALDRVLRQQMRLELERIQRQTGITTVYVTHDQMEAFSLSDRVIVLENGHISQKGEPYEIYENPSSAFVADFIGRSSKLEGTIGRRNGTYVFLTDSATELTLSDDQSYDEGDDVVVFLRSEKIQISNTKSGNENEFPADIIAVNYLGEKTQFICELESGHEILISEQGFTDVKNYRRGDQVYIIIPPEDIIINEP